MNPKLKQLIEIVTPLKFDHNETNEVAASELQSDYVEFLSLTNGGYTLDGFFHFFGWGGPSEHDIVKWNAFDLWKQNYSLQDDSFVFAEDAFGLQYFFDIRHNRRVVKLLDINSGKISLCANTFADFVEDEVLGSDFNAHFRELAKRFLVRQGCATSQFTHISYKVPLILGGASEDEGNMELLNSITNLTVLGQIVHQARELKPGTKITNITANTKPK